MRKTITIDDKEIILEANALTPYLFKNIFNQDVFYKMQKSAIALQNTKKGELPDIDIEFYYQLIWLMAKTAKKKDGEEIEDLESWIEQFNLYSIYGAITDVVQLWAECCNQTSKPAKK